MTLLCPMRTISAGVLVLLSYLLIRINNFPLMIMQTMIQDHSEVYFYMEHFKCTLQCASIQRICSIITLCCSFTKTYNQYANIVDVYGSQSDEYIGPVKL
uniref:Uncharacterized protein n=1 Tax=Oryza brachyantha TaxID=4533 RepID=J3N140_ORYBR